MSGSTRALAAAFAVLALAAPRAASASVVEHHVTPGNVGSTDGIDVTVVRRGDGELVLRLVVQRAPVGVYEPRLRARDGAPAEVIAFEDADADPLVAIVVMRTPDAVVTVMRDYGLIGHSYVIRARDWRGVAD